MNCIDDKPNIRYRDWLAKKKQEPEFFAMYEGPRVNYQIARLRIMRGLTQQQLADLIGAKQPSIARLESGKHTPTLDVLAKIASALKARLTVSIDPIEEEQHDA